MSRRILAAVAAVVIVAAAMGVRYLVVSADASAGAARAGADHLLKGIDSDTMQVDRTLAAPLFPNMRARDPNFGIRKQAFDAHVERIDQARSLVAVDQGKLRSAGDTLRETRFTFRGRLYRQRERIYVARVAAFEPRLEAMEDYEAAMFRELRWWAADEIERSTEVFGPRRLGGLLRRLLSEGYPSEPIDVGT